MFMSMTMTRYVYDYVYVIVKTKVKTAFVNSLCYLNRPNTSKTHSSDDLFINAAIMQLN